MKKGQVLIGDVGWRPVPIRSEDNWVIWMPDSSNAWQVNIGPNGGEDWIAKGVPPRRAKDAET